MWVITVYVSHQRDTWVTEACVSHWCKIHRSESSDWFIRGSHQTDFGVNVIVLIWRGWSFATLTFLGSVATFWQLTNFWVYQEYPKIISCAHSFEMNSEKSWRSLLFICARALNNKTLSCDAREVGKVTCVPHPRKHGWGTCPPVPSKFPYKIHPSGMMVI